MVPETIVDLSEVNMRYNGPALEQTVLVFWQQHQIFNKCQQQNQSGPPYIWNEGPPTANGKPGLHHVLARSFKDIFPRYKHMCGYYCPRKAGWDTHGLPVEHEIEKQLQIFERAEIERQIGISEFNRRCRESVMGYIDNWEQMTNRMGFWVDMKSAYYTLNNNYIESVWWLFQQLWNNNLIYQGYKVVPYDPRIGATLSSHEVSLGYKEVEDPAITLRFRLTDTPNTAFLVWTTTPWTIPANLALAVHPDIEYATVRCGEEYLIVALARLEEVLFECSWTIEKTTIGSDLVGIRYQRVFDYLPVSESYSDKVCRVLPGDFVSSTDGTGIVHVAPAYGQDDLNLGQEHGLPVIHGVGLDGRFIEDVTPVAGLFFKDADAILIEQLQERGLLYCAERVKHNYPHGWRTGDPLIYYAKYAWYIRTSSYRDRMVELNRTINWVPATIKEGRFGNWLQNNVDWAVSRERFWGTPLPLWKDSEEDYICIGSVAELETLCDRKLSDIDLHRPAIDNISFVHPKNGHRYSRVTEVLDCWFDSGAMSYAQFHYPFANQETFAQSFPADYICEAIDQTRGWFYSLHAIAVMVSDSVAYRNCICLGHIVDQDGLKMSKSRGNIIDPYQVFDSVGADALRWYLVCRIAPETQKRISVNLVREVASGFLNTYWNTYAFFVMYAIADNIDLTVPLTLLRRPPIDRWLLAQLQQLIAGVSQAMENYDAMAAGQQLESFIDQLSNSYIRCCRRRFWKSDNSDDKQSAYLTLYECLHTVNRMLAPFMPFITETVHQNLLRNTNIDTALSVHMSRWPTVVADQRDDALVVAFSSVWQIIALGRVARAKSGVRTRQPLPRLLVHVTNPSEIAAIEENQQQILEELNVKRLHFVTADRELLSYRVKPNLPLLGKQYGKLIPAIRQSLMADAARIAKSVAANEAFPVDVEGTILQLTPQQVLVETISVEGYTCADGNGYLVGLELQLTEALKCEGLARELVRTVQETRKQAGLELTDRIMLAIDGGAAVQTAIEQHCRYITEETLADCINTAEKVDSSHQMKYCFGQQQWTVELARSTP